MSEKRLRCAVVGAANIDIGGFPSGMAVMGDSNPGRIRMSSGGVGRNIACTLARLGIETQLVTALGDDVFAGAVRADCRAAGVALDHALVFRAAASSAYLFIANPAGDMQLAVNDMAICERLTPEALEPRLEVLNAMDAVILDANLPGRTIAWLAERLRPPLVADAVSAAKARRLLPALPRLSVLKPNALEAAALTGLPTGDAEGAKAAARRLAAMGVGRVFITLGERGVCCADASRSVLLPGAPVRLVNATGAGDAFTAALAWAALKGLSMEEASLAGLAAAAIAVESAETVSPDISEAALTRRMAFIREQESGMDDRIP